MMFRQLALCLLSLSISTASAQESKLNKLRARDYGIQIGLMQPGKYNAITDVSGVKVGHKTLKKPQQINTGVTAIIPHSDNLFQKKVPAAVYTANGFGKLTGSTQIEELGNLETPIVLTNTLSVPTAMDALIKYTLNQKGNEKIYSVNPVVGETNDGLLNDIRGQHVNTSDVLEAIQSAASEDVDEGSIGAGTGTICFGFKGGIGTSSRILPESLGGYTVGVLVQSNFGGALTINGAPVGKELGDFSFSKQLLDKADGSCMVIVATDAPLNERNLKRLAKRAFLGLGKTGGIASNGSGDYFIAFSTHPDVRIPYQSKDLEYSAQTVHNDHLSPLFMAAIEATEEAIINSLFAAEAVDGHRGEVSPLPLKQVIPILQKYKAIKTQSEQ